MRAHLGRTLRESAEGSEKRKLRVLDLLRHIVPYEKCALLNAQPGREASLLVAQATPADVRATLSETLVDLHARLVDEHGHPPEAPVARESAAHLAVPLVGNDAVIGVLFVGGRAPEGPADGYTEQHLRELSIVGAYLAAYLVMLDQARALEEARREAEGANRMKDEFLALVSRELKTPLTSLLVWAHMLRSEKTEPSGRALAVEGIERNVEAQAKLIDEILDLACIAAADLRLDLKAVEPAILIKSAVEGQRLRAKRRSIRLETAFGESVDQLIVDPVRIAQVISNLLANAIQFTQPGGCVGVRLERVGAHARIQVIDHGRGISAEALPHVFERDSAYRGDPVTAGDREPGSRLGTVKTVVAAHGGRVRAESLGHAKGSTFTVELPLPADVPGEASRVLAGIRVLLVDDDEDMRFAVTAVLELHGAHVTSVASAAAALAALELSRPHVLLSDISMPGESGYDLMRKVASRDATLPAVALTAFVRGEDQTRALAAGFRMHLGKPFDVLALVRAVATLAGRPLAKGLEEAVTQ